jgi:hypothetical protein
LSVSEVFQHDGKLALRLHIYSVGGFTQFCRLGTLHVQ